MTFNKFELFLIKTLKIGVNANGRKTSKFYNKLLKFSGLSLMNNEVETNQESQTQELQEPQRQEPRREEMTTSNKKEPEPGRTKKIVFSSIGIILLLGLFALIILSGFSFQPAQLVVGKIGYNASYPDSYIIYPSSDSNSGTAFSKNRIPNVYQTSSTNVEVTFGTSAFNSYYYSATLVWIEKSIGTSSSTGSTSSSANESIIKIHNYDDPITKLDSYVKSSTYASTGSAGTISTPGLVVANVLVDLTSGYVYEIGTTGGATAGNATDPSNTFNYSANLTKTLGYSLQGAKITTTKPIPYSFSTVTSIVLSILPFLLIFGFLWWSMKRMGGAGSGQDNVFSIGKSQAKLAQSNVLFSDVAGIEEEKEELIEIVDYLKRPEKYASMGARVPKGVILYGPPGTGKTLLAKAVAGEAKVPFFQVSGSAFEDMLVGVGAKRVRDLFSKAVKSAPAIIFIDEIDSVGSKRGKFDTTAGSLADQTLNQLLAEMDGFSPRSGVIVIAATNRLDVLDEALLRPGRFDRHIKVNLPDIKERVAILNIHSRNKNISTTVDLEDIARRTPGFSGAQLENVLNEATILAVRKDKNAITLDDLDEAIDRVIAGPAKKTRVISLDEKRQIAYHEAGHAIVGLYTKGSEVVEKITIIPRGQAAGYTLSVPEVQELSIQKKSDLLGMVAGLLGGRASEEIVFGKDSISTGAANDFYKATNIVRSMVTQLGMSSIGMAQYYPSEGVSNPYQQRTFSESTAQLIDKEIEKIFKERYEYASKIIKKNRKELDLIVESLLLLETIVKPQIDYIHKYKKLPLEAIEKKKELEEKLRTEELIRKHNEMQQQLEEEFQEIYGKEEVQEAPEE